MPKKAKELSNLEVRRLKHAIASSGKPYNAVYAVGGVSQAFIFSAFRLKALMELELNHGF